MDATDRRAGKLRLLTHLRAGQPWPVAGAAAGVRTSERSVFRLLRRVRLEGEAAALADGRQGHPRTLRGPMRQWLAEYCRGAPEAGGRQVQAAVRERFGLAISVSQINRVRAALGLSRRAPGVGGKGATDAASA